MTNEEAIKLFNTVLLFGECDCSKEKIEECLKKAIKALEQEPCEDAISREAVKEKLREEWIKYVPMELDINLSFVLEKISELPSVTPKPRIGHWKRVEFGMFDSVSIRWECSECKKIDMFRSNFCFNCGAKMESEVRDV